MTPIPQGMSPGQNAESRATFDGDAVVISGMSGLYPNSHSVKELSDILYNKINPIKPNSTRWKYNHPEVAQCTGMVPDLEHFDAQFFKVHARLGQSMDSMGRKILEQTYQAIFDAGISPEQLSGKKVGVYIGTCFSETEKACFYVASSRTGFGIAGCSKTMFANRISYWLNAKGPSLSIDESCCSSIAALEQAYLAISRGECEAAIVGGTNLCLHPQSSLHYARIITLCKDGKTKSFDQNADGCAKSEAINVLFLQKAKDALRIYANVVHVKSEYTAVLQTETGPRYGFYRDSQKMANFLKKFYDDAGVPAGAVEYVEAVGSAVSEADKAELEAIGEVFCKDRANPLLVGSVMSNIGYGEAASGISAITKVLLGYCNGELACNLHYETPRKDVEAVREGRLRVLTEHTRFGRTYTAVNGISVTGVNSHVLLHGHYKPKDLDRYKCGIPHLVTISGRQDSAVNKIIQDLKRRPIDPEELALLHNIHKTKMTGHMGRGFVILDTKDQSTVSLCQKADYFNDAKRPLWFVYSGMGSQWAGMGTQLMRIPIFAAAIERCHQALAPKGLNIVNIITSPDKSMFDNILHSFVGIAAIQIGLTDILRALGILPDKIIGHSVGELGCAYADGCLTAEEMILSAYSRGLVSVQTPFIRGSMAAVGLGYQQISKMCPPEIEVACHNAAESSTISGPADIMREFVGKLTAQGIFAKEVPCSNIAYHSRYIAEAGPGLLEKLKEVIKSPRARSERWVSTSVPQNRWDEPIAKLSSAEYHTNNLLSPVLFEETSVLIPPNAVLVEIAPHGLLQAILKRSLPESCCNIALTRRGHPDNAYLVLEAVGKLYMEGYTPNIEVLYPKIEFPVSTSTPMLSHLVEWAHGERWSLPLYASANRKMAASCKFVISVHDEENSYLQGHVVRGQTLYPFAAALVAAWDTLAMSLNLPKKQVSVEFRDVHLYAQPVLHDQRQLRLTVSLHRGTGRFEIMDENSKVAAGFVIINKAIIKKTINQSEGGMDVRSVDVYTMLNTKDYSYSGEFRSIHSTNWSMSEALLLWRDNWVTLLDGMLQLNVLRHAHDGVSVPKHIRKLCIDVDEHTKNIMKLGADTVLKAEISHHEYTRCGGVQIEHLKLRDIPLEPENNFSINSLQFVPRLDHELDFSSTLHVYLQIVAENLNGNVINVVSIITSKAEARIFEEIKCVLHNSNLNFKYEEINVQDIKQGGEKKLADIDLVLVRHLSMDDRMCQLLFRALKRDTFLISEEENIKSSEIRPSALYRALSVGGGLQLVRWRPTSVPSGGAVVSAFTSSDIPLLSAARSSMQPGGRMLVLAPQPPPSGLIDLIRAWRKEPARNQINLVMIDPNTADGPLETEVDLAFNVWNNERWGGEYYVPLQKNSEKYIRAELQMTRFGDIDSLYWTEALMPQDIGIKVNVHYAGINNVDVIRASGLIPFKNDSVGFGMDFSGVLQSGERVMGVVLRGACSSEVRAQPELLWPVPEHWTLEDAATVPLAYLNAFYCFLGSKTGTRIVDDDENFSILVHGGAGALGQAAISIALGLGYEVFTTVSDVAKKQFLLKLFPQLKEKNIGNSRDLSFGDMVLSGTNGKGCDIVISNVKGDLKDVSLRCCADSGVTYDMCQLTHQEDYLFGMSHLSRERSYIALDLSSVLAKWQSDDIKTLHGLVSAGIADGYVRPLSRVTYAPHDAPRAFRLLAASAHRGRVLLQLNQATVLTTPRFHAKCDDVHLILCDSTTLGLQLAKRLIKRGARKLHLHCVCPPRYLEYNVRCWRTQNIQVNLSSEDLLNEVPLLIKNAMQLDALVGVHVIATDSVVTSDKKFESVLRNLDLITRKLCPQVRYFTVTCPENTIGMDTCVTRVKEGYPTTLLQFKLSDADTDVWMSSVSAGSSACRGLVDMVERAALSSQSVLLARQIPALAEPLLHQLAKQAGITVDGNCSEDATLESLGIQNEKLESVANLLQLYHNIALNEEDIKSLTVKRIQEIEDTIYPKNYKETKGVSTFFTHVDPDELQATTEMVFLPTLTCNSMRDDEIDVTQTHLYIVPGLEGLHSRFNYLCERLKLPALVLQPGLDRPNETIQETAQRYADVILARIGFKKEVYILGFEWGIPVALELASILEGQGMSATIFCIGFAPEELKEVLEEELSEYKTEEELQSGVLEHMFALMAGVGGEYTGIEAAVRRGGTWSEQVETCVRTLLGRVSHSAQYARALLQAALGRLLQARRYSSTMPPLKSKLVLLRPTHPSRSSSSSAELLGTLTTGEVSVHQLSTPLAHAARDVRCAAIINAHLHPDILQAYNDNNHCDTYLLNADTFMTSTYEMEKNSGQNS